MREKNVDILMQKKVICANVVKVLKLYKLNLLNLQTTLGVCGTKVCSDG